jgi:hypothetical protein
MVFAAVSLWHQKQFRQRVKKKDMNTFEKASDKTKVEKTIMKNIHNSQGFHLVDKIVEKGEVVFLNENSFSTFPDISYEEVTRGGNRPKLTLEEGVWVFEDSRTHEKRAVAVTPEWKVGASHKVVIHRGYKNPGAYNALVKGYVALVVGRAEATSVPIQELMASGCRGASALAEELISNQFPAKKVVGYAVEKGHLWRVINHGVSYTQGTPFHHDFKVYYEYEYQKFSYDGEKVELVATKTRHLQSGGAMYSHRLDF